MFGLEEPYLCIKVNFVGFSLVLWLVLGFSCKFQLKRGKYAISAEIVGKCRY